MFFIKSFLVFIWFVVSCCLTFLVVALRWRSQSNAYFFANVFCNGAAKILGFKIKVTNRDWLFRNKPCVYLGNHQSNFDLIVHGSCCTYETVAVGKRELMWMPLFGFLFYITGNVLLDRKNRDRAIESLDEAARYINEKQISVYMFPEGTRNFGSRTLLPFKKGSFHLAIAAQVPLVPIIAAPLSRVIDVGKKKIYPGIVRMEVLEPIPTTHYTVDTVDELMKITYQKMQDAFDRLSLS